MPRPRPFTCHLVAPARAEAVVAPPYDSLTPDQRSAMAAADPESFLNALPPAGPGSDADLASTLESCRRNVQRFVATGRFLPLAGPVLAIVTLESGGDRTVAIVGDLPASAFDLDATGALGMVRPHERVDPARVDQLARYLEVVGVASSPVAVAHRPSDAVAAATAPVLERPPRIGFQGDDGVDIAVWIVNDEREQAALADAVEGAGTLYVADGHHRAAAAGARAVSGGSRGVGSVLTAVIPTDHLAVLPFHRRLVGAPDPSPQGVLRRLREVADPDELDVPWQPDRPGCVAVTAGGRWWRLDLRDHVQPGPVEGLDVRLVERSILPALLDGASPAPFGSPGMPRVEPVPGPAGLAALERDGTVGIALAPPRAEAILEVADAGQVMPPKTTYVTPKLRSGIFLAPR